MLRLVNYEEIQSKLQLVSAIIDTQARNDPQFSKRVEKWLSDMESILNSNKAPEAGKIASLRGSLISADIGVLSKTFNIKPNLSRSKIKVAVAIDTIQQATDIVLNFIQKDRERFLEAERIMSQLVAISKFKGLLNDLPLENNTEVLNFYWKKLSKENELMNGVVSIEGLVGPFDTLIIFNRML